MPGSRRDGAHVAEGLAIIGQSPALREVLRRVERVGPTEATVLILGERGTGKELVARALAARSPRRAQPFIAVNCAALPPELLASELFGHERGAFTGAIERRPGLLASAHGGTVFLDEVGDLPVAGQAMLLRCLQEREVRPLGASVAHPVDVRVIAATNREIGRATGDSAFRADLHDRLTEVVIRVPPLRERRQDIPLLVEHFLTLHATRHRLLRPQMSPRALALLRGYAWPGNVRELEKALSRAVIFSGGAQVRPRDLDLDGSPTPIFFDGELGTEMDLTERQRELLRMARASEGIRRGDVTERFGISREAARRELHGLVRRGLLRREGQCRGTRYLPVRVEH